MDIFYRLGQKLYVNITNKCPCACVFCIRDLTDSVGDAKSLWLTNEPTIEEITTAFRSRTDLNQVTEIVFCGYGEPTERGEILFETCKLIKHHPIRINTNGLARLINPNFNMRNLSAVNSISVSLNADDAEEYMRLVNPRFGINSYQEVLDFAKAATEYTKVTLSVVQSHLSPERVERCKSIAAGLGLPLRIRTTV